MVAYVNSAIIIRSKLGLAEYWTHFTARFGGVHAFGYNSVESEPIWMKSGTLWVHCRGELILADFGRDPRSSESWRATRNFCQVSNARFHRFPVGPANFTKFEHNTSIDVAIKTFGTEFGKFCRKGPVFQERKTKRKIF